MYLNPFLVVLLLVLPASVHAQSSINTCPSGQVIIFKRNSPNGCGDFSVDSTVPDTTASFSFTDIAQSGYGCNDGFAIAGITSIPSSSSPKSSGLQVTCRKVRGTSYVSSQTTCNADSDALQKISVLFWMQSYLSPNAKYISNIHAIIPSESELRNVTLVLQKIWELDNRLIQGDHFELESEFKRKKPIFRRFERERIMAERPTFRYFDALLDNYIAPVNFTEITSLNEREEERLFLKAITETPIIQYLSHYLALINVINSTTEITRFLDELWFTPYQRAVVGDTSTFEHIFAGELENGLVIGMHSWWQYARVENLGNMIYYRQYNYANQSRTENDPLLKIKFSWLYANMKHMKPLTTLILGSTPEYEVAIYTICALLPSRKAIFRIPHVQSNVELMCYVDHPPGRIILLTAFVSQI